jgi:protein SCO1/2
MPTAAPGEDRSASRPRGRILTALVTAVVLASLAVAVGVRTLARGAVPPRYATLPAFSLVERSGRPLSLADLRGRIWVADFIFTRCGGTCPAMTARMVRLRGEIPSDVAFVSFSVDPAHDTPEVLTRYAAAFHANEEWLFVTGPQKDLFDLSIGGFKLAAMEVAEGERVPGGDGPFLHSSKFVLVDGDGVIRGYYDSTDEEAMRALAGDAAALRTRR